MKPEDFIFSTMAVISGLTKESIIDWTQFSENLPSPLFAKEGLFLPLEKGGREGFYKNFFSLWFISMSALLWTD